MIAEIFGVYLIVGLQILSSSLKYVNSDPDMVALHQESISRLEFIDVLYAGYDRFVMNGYFSALIKIKKTAVELYF